MKKYQIVDCGADFQYAGTKATQDVADIAEKMGYRRCTLRMRSVSPTKTAKLWRQIGYFMDWVRCCREIEAGSLVLLQHPFHYPQLIRQLCLWKMRRKNVRFICVVHDVEELRGYRYNDYYKEEFRFMLEIADAVIVHNAMMKSFFVKKGMEEAEIIPLGIFDYLQKSSPRQRAQFDRRIVIAGNLDTQKSAYIGQLGQFMAVRFDLYGNHFDETLKQYSNIVYRGFFQPDHPSEHLTCGLGLVWDGDSTASCEGLAGGYLRYNNPHKLSLYLSCGLPVVIWDQAAEASFVSENRVGLCVSSLSEMEQLVSHLDEKTYNEMAENAANVGRKLRSGVYMECAVKCAEKIVINGSNVRSACRNA